MLSAFSEHYYRTLVPLATRPLDTIHKHRQLYRHGIQHSSSIGRAGSGCQFRFFFLCCLSALCCWLLTDLVLGTRIACEIVTRFISRSRSSSVGKRARVAAQRNVEVRGVFVTSHQCYDRCEHLLTACFELGPRGKLCVKAFDLVIRQVVKCG
jgi:hypothetical protein